MLILEKHLVHNGWLIINILLQSKLSLVEMLYALNTLNCIMMSTLHV